MVVIDNSPSLPIPELTRYRREVPFHRGIEELANYIDFEVFRPKLEELCHYGSKGRPHYDEVLMFRVLILQTLYDLSDEAMEYNVGDRDSFKKFIGIGHADNIPDARTIWKFRERLGADGSRELFDLFYAYMKEKGLQCSKGKIIDATFQEARIQRNTPKENEHIKEKGTAPEEWSKKKKAHKDTDATFTKKGNATHYGYKGHVYADEKSKIIENYETTTASVHDSQVCAELIPEAANNQNIEVLADSGYFGEKIALHCERKA